MSSTTKPPPGRNAIALSGSAASSSSSYSPGSSAMPPDDDDVAVGRPVAGLRRLDDALHVLAESRPERARVDGELARDAEVDSRLALRRNDSGATTFTLSSSPGCRRTPESLPRRALTTVSRASGSRTRRPRALRSARPDDAISRTRVHRRDQRADRAGTPRHPASRSRCTLRSPVRPRQISSVTSGSSGAASRRDGLEHRVERVEGVRDRRRPRSGRGCGARTSW